MQAWLTERGIPFDNKARKKDLFALIKDNKTTTEYVADKLIMQSGHQVLRLPPYHCDLNPIELLWGIIKNDVARNNVTFKLDAMKQLTENAVKKVSLETIQNTFEHIEKLEQQYWERDGLQFAPIVEKTVINMQDSSSSSSEAPSSFASSTDEAE